MRPSVYWGAPDDGAWSDDDRLATMALTLYEDGLCTGCGSDKSTAYSPDANGWYDIHAVSCAGCAALEAVRESKQRVDPGTKFFPVLSEGAAAKIEPWSHTGVPVSLDTPPEEAA